MKQRFFFEELHDDIRQLVFHGIKFRINKDPLPEDVVQFGLDDLLNEEAADTINRHNWSRTIKEWLEFAETGN